MYQGHEKELAVVSARSALRSVTVYDQFALLGKFDALWLSDSVRSTFARMYALKWGKSPEQAEQFVARQQEENRRFISFYLFYPFDLMPLGMIDSVWSIFLQIDGKTDRSYPPLEIKTIELSPEYQHMVGSVYTRFKQVYELKFDATNSDDQQLISPNTKQIALCFRSVTKEVSLVWQLHDGELVLSARAKGPVKRSASWAEENVYGSGQVKAVPKKRVRKMAGR